MRRTCLALLLLLLVVPAAHANSRQRSIFQDDRLLLNPATRGEALDTIRSLGADTIRVTVIYDRWQSDPGQYIGLAADARARGFALLLTVTGRKSDLPSTSGYGAFVRDVATRIPGAHAWGIWNEPNLNYWMGSQGTAPQRYRVYFNAAVAGLRAAGHGSDTILLGETAPRKTGVAASPLAFMVRVLCLKTSYAGCRHPHRLAATGIAHHPYTNNQLASPAVTGPPANDVSIGSLSRLTKLVDAAARQGRVKRNLPLWLTEFGFQTHPPTKYAPSPRTAALYQNWSEWIAFHSSRVVAMSQYDLDDGTSTDASSTGLRFANGKEKATLPAYRLPIYVTHAGRGHVRVFGQVRPGSGTRTVRVQRKAGSRWKTVKTVRVSGRGFLEPRLGGTGGSWRLSWAGRTSRTASVR